MGTWNDLNAAAPDLAQRATAILTSTTNAVLATVRAVGSPRLSGIDPWFSEGELWIGSMPGARKADDLARDPRMALHCVPWESRRLKEGADDPGDADAKLSGLAMAVTDPAEVARALGTFSHDRGIDAPDQGTYFKIAPTALVVTYVDGDELVQETWTNSSGRQTVRRT